MFYDLFICFITHVKTLLFSHINALCPYLHNVPTEYVLPYIEPIETTYNEANGRCESLQVIPLHSNHAPAPPMPV